MANKIIQVSNYGRRTSVSMDPILFELFYAHVGNSPEDKIRDIALKGWKHYEPAPKGLSKTVQHEILKMIVKPSLIKKVFKTDEHCQDELGI